MADDAETGETIPALGIMGGGAGAGEPAEMAMAEDLEAELNRLLAEGGGAPLEPAAPRERLDDTGGGARGGGAPRGGGNALMTTTFLVSTASDAVRAGCAGVRSLSSRWGDAEAGHLAAAMRDRAAAAGAGGGEMNLQILELGRGQFSKNTGRNRIGDHGATRIAHALAAGAGANLRVLDLGIRNNVGEDGARAVLDAIDAGHAPRLRELVMDLRAVGAATRLRLVDCMVDGGGKLATKDIEVALAALECPRCTAIDANNAGRGINTRLESPFHFKDEGATRIAQALVKGGGASLRELVLTNNRITVAGIARIANALASSTNVAPALATIEFLEKGKGTLNTKKNSELDRIKEACAARLERGRKKPKSARKLSRRSKKAKPPNRNPAGAPAGGGGGCGIKLATELAALKIGTKKNGAGAAHP